MKKITKILSLTVVVASMMTPLALLTNNSNGVNVKQEVNEVGGGSTVELNNVNKTDNGVETNNQAIDANSETDNDIVNVNETISSNNCTAEDSGQITTAWMGITGSFINFTVSKDYVSESNIGEVKITPVFDIDLMRLKGNNLTIPNYIVSNNEKYNVVEIGDNAFDTAFRITGTLTISSSVTTIGTRAFSGCYGLTGSLAIPANVKTIDKNAFSNCSGLTSLDLSKATGLTTLMGFDSCTGLTSLDLSKATSLATIGDNAFSTIDTKKMNITGPLTIPASVTSIGSSAFFECEGLTRLDFSNATSLTSIGDGAFFVCTGLSGTLTIPANVTTIGNNAFAECTGLTSLNLSNATSLTSIGYSAFFGCTGLTGPLTIPASVTTISNQAFQDCTGLESLDLSKATSLTSIGAQAFFTCTGLTGPLTIPATVISIDNSAFSGTNFQEFNFISETPPTTLGTNIFGTNVTKTLWVPSAQAKTAYDQYAVNEFGLLDDSYIKFKEIAPTSVDITGVDGPYTINLNETNKTIVTAKADVQPSTATNKDVTWSLVDEPTWLSINTTSGVISTNDNLKNATPGNFTFKVKAVCQANAVSSTTSNIKINVTYAPITSIAIQTILPVNVTLGSVPATLTTCKATVSPSTADPKQIKWSIPNNKPTWLDINLTTGVISTNSSVVDKNLPLQLIILFK